MRRARFKGLSSHPFKFFHCTSRIVNRDFVLGEVEKGQFYKFMRLYERLLGLRVASYCLMSNHFHILVEVPRRPADGDLLNDEGLIAHVESCLGEGAATNLRWELEHFRGQGNDAAAEALREKWFGRMWDVSQFMKVLKQRFTQWYNGRNNRKGTLWEDRFHSVLVEGEGPALKAMAAYIDLNPVRAKICDDPKDYRWCGYGEAFLGTGAGGKKGAKLAKTAVVWLDAIGNTRLQDATTVSAAKAKEIKRAKRAKTSSAEAMMRWRCFLFGVPESELARAEESAREAAGGEAQIFRKRISRVKALEVLDSGGRLKKADYLRCRLRYFVDGAAIGSKAFIEEVFQESRGHFHSERKSGARSLRGLETLPMNDRLYNMRQMGKDAVS